MLWSNPLVLQFSGTPYSSFPIPGLLSHDLSRNFPCPSPTFQNEAKLLISRGG
jgi:hypothetical protein